MSRGLLGMLTGLSCWAFLWWALNALLPLFFPKMFKHDGTTESFLLNLLLVLASLDIAFLSGWLCARLTKKHERRFAFVLGLLQLGVAIYMHQHYWPRPPFGFYIAFLGLMLPAVVGGAMYHSVQRSEEAE